MADLAQRGYTGVLHTFSENDFAYYRDTMAEIVGISHEQGLCVEASPWGLGRTFGGEAESRWVAFHPEECQVLDDGRRVAAACLNSQAYRAFCKEWADWVLECGVDIVFWDEPAWVVPAHVGVDDPDALDLPLRSLHRAVRWADPCRAHPRGAGLSSGVGRRLPGRGGGARRRARRLERDLPAAGDRGRQSAWPTGTRSRRCPDSRSLVTDPYWKHWDEAAGPFVRRFARLLRETADRARRRGAAVAAEFRAHARRHPGARGCDRGRPRGGRR